MRYLDVVYYCRIILPQQIISEAPMKSSILTITLTTLLVTSPLCAQQSFFDALFNAIQQNPKTSLLCALAGCALSAKIAYSTAYESTLQERKMADFLQSHPMIILSGEPMTEEQQSLLKNFKLYLQDDKDYPLCLFLHETNNAASVELINEPNVQDYQFIHTQGGQPFRAVAYSLNLKTYSEPSTFNHMLNNKYDKGYEHGKKDGDQEGYERGRGESSSGKIKEKGKQLKQKLIQ
jgi:hypothetical protein